MKGDTGKISPAKINGTGEVGEDGIGAGKINAFHESGVGVEPTKYGVGIKHRSGKIGVHEGYPGEIDSSEIHWPGNAVEHGIGAGQIYAICAIGENSGAIKKSGGQIGAR